MIITQISNNIQQIQEGIGGNLANFFRDITLFIAGLIVAFTQGWKLTLVAVAMIPIIKLFFTALTLVIQLFTIVELQAYSTASNMAAETLGSVRTVFAFGGEEHASKRYDNELGTAQHAGVKRGILMGSSKSMLCGLLQNF